MKTSTLSPYRWTILIIVCAICFMANFMQYQVSAWGVTVMDMMQTDVAGLTNLMLMPMLTAVFLSIPSGSLADKFGVKRVVSVALTISVAGGFLRSFTLGSVPAQTVAMFLIGFGIAALNANLAKILGTWFKEQTSLAMGFFYAASCVAIVIAQVFSTLMGTLFASYLIAAFLMAAAAVAWIVFARNVPAGEPLPESEPIVQYLKIACKSKNVWFIALAYGLTLASTTAYCSILPSALELGRGIDTMLAGSLAAIITVGSFLACFAGPAAVLKLGKKQAVSYRDHLRGRRGDVCQLVRAARPGSVDNPGTQWVLHGTERSHYPGHDSGNQRDRNQICGKRRRHYWHGGSIVLLPAPACGFLYCGRQLDAEPVH